MARKRKPDPSPVTTAVADPPGLRFRCRRNDLLAAAKVAVQVAGTATPHDKLISGVRIHVGADLRLAATDHEGWISIGVGCHPERLRPGALTVKDPNRLIAMLNECRDEDVEFTGDEYEGLRLATSSGTFTFAAGPVAHSDPEPPNDSACRVTLSPADLASHLSAVLPMGGRPRLKLGWQFACNGVCVAPRDGLLRLSATDFNRTGVADAPAEVTDPGYTPGVIPIASARLIRELALAHAADEFTVCELHVERTRLVAEFGLVTFTTRFMEGKVPDPVDVLSGVKRTAEVLRDPLLSAVRGVENMVGEDGLMKVAIDRSYVTVSARSSKFGYGTVSVPAGGFKGEWSGVARASDVARALSAAPSDMVAVGPGGPSQHSLTIKAGVAFYLFDGARLKTEGETDGE